MKQTVGQQLRSAREKLGISLGDAARETHIRLNYLQELEDDHPEQLHSVAQARGFLRLYADFLNLPYEDLLILWDRPDEEKTQKPDSTGQPLPRGRRNWLKKRSPAEEEIAVPDDELNENTAAASDENPADDIPVFYPEVEKEEQEVLSEEILHTEEQGIVEAAEQAPVEASAPGKQVQFRERVQTFFTGLSSQLARIKPLKKLLKRNDADEQGESAEVAVDLPTQTSDEVFVEIGNALQTRRKMMELNLSDIENFTNLKRTVLVAIEDGRFNDLPSTVQGRGMLNNYAKFLGMEESAVMDMYGSALQLQREEKQRPQRKPVQSPVSVKFNVPEKWRKIINPDLLIGSALIIGLFAFIIWGASQVFNSSENTPTEAPSISEVLQITPSVSPDPDLAQTPEEGQVVEEATALPGVAVAENTPTVVATVNAAPLQLYIIAHDRAYLKITVDGFETFNGRIIPDNVYTYSGNESIDLLTGNAYALEVYFNQEYLGNLGDVGEVVSIDFTLEGLETPPPTPTSTPPA